MFPVSNNHQVLVGSTNKSNPTQLNGSFVFARQFLQNNQSFTQRHIQLRRLLLRRKGSFFLQEDIPRVGLVGWVHDAGVRRVDDYLPELFFGEVIQLHNGQKGICKGLFQPTATPPEMLLRHQKPKAPPKHYASEGSVNGKSRSHQRAQ
jgi:hypothetical protein